MMADAGAQTGGVFHAGAGQMRSCRASGGASACGDTCGHRTAARSRGLLLAPAELRCAELPPIAPGAGSGSCSEAAQQAERVWNLPDGLLRAIGRTESGRPDPDTGELEPSPWAINASGNGHVFDSADAAIAYVQSLQAHGVRSIDVGCFQINLVHHPAAFASLSEAFDVNANAAAAAQFLAELYQRSGDCGSPRARQAVPNAGAGAMARRCVASSGSLRPDWNADQRRSGGGAARPWRGRNSGVHPGEQRLSGNFGSSPVRLPPAGFQARMSLSAGNCFNGI